MDAFSNNSSDIDSNTLRSTSSSVLLLGARSQEEEESSKMHRRPRDSTDSSSRPNDDPDKNENDSIGREDPTLILPRADSDLEVTLDNPGSVVGGPKYEKTVPPPPPPPPSSSSSQKVIIFLRKVRHFLFNQLLIVTLILGIALGLVWPAPGVYYGADVNGTSPSQIIMVILIFLISGLKLRTSEIKSAFKEYKGAIFGLVLILFISTVVGMSSTKAIDFPGLREFRSGLLLFWAMPTTTSSGVVLVQEAFGNGALATLFCVFTNIMAALTVPLYLKWFNDFHSAVSLDLAPLIRDLILTILVPLLIGKGLSYLKVVQQFTKAWPTLLKVVPVLCISALPWIKVSKTMDKGGFDSVKADSFFAVFGWASFMHIVFLIIGYSGCWVLRIKPPEMKAIVVMGSQKTLATAVAVINLLPKDVGDKGIMSISCVICHLTQIVIDTFLVAHWSKAHKKELERKKEQAEGIPLDTIEDQQGDQNDFVAAQHLDEDGDLGGGLKKEKALFLESDQPISAESEV